ncbi:pilus assembly FimT family protein [Janthinobacterium sp. RT4P48]|uniref:pilus assembly FimT family protein n=1 Tax=Janthinobacterium sp. RT4P48 TaxID=3424188 RepID=UPI003F1F2E0E
MPVTRLSAPRRAALPSRRRGARGFTLIELVTVLVLAGVMAAFAGARFFQRETFDARSFSDQAASMLRYAQKLAVAQNRPVFVRLDAGGLAVCFDALCSPASRVVAPGGRNSGSRETRQYCNGQDAWLCEGVPASVALGTNPASTAGFYFDALGQPYALANAFPAPSTFPARLRLGIQGTDMLRTITVEGVTGYVY